MAETKRVYEIADEVGMESADVVAYLQAHGYPEVTTHASAVPAEAVETVVAGLRAFAAPASNAQTIGEAPPPVEPGAGAQAEESKPEAAPGAAGNGGRPGQGEGRGRRKRTAGANPGPAAGPSPTVRRRTAAASAPPVDANRGNVLFRLQRKASVGAPGLRVVKGGMITAAQYAALPARVKAYFDRVA